MCCFVLNEIPVLDETSILQANDVHHSLRENDFRQAGSRVPATHYLHCGHQRKHATRRTPLWLTQRFHCFGLAGALS
jgi:hypothetical protein